MKTGLLYENSEVRFCLQMKEGLVVYRGRIYVVKHNILTEHFSL